MNKRTPEVLTLKIGLVGALMLAWCAGCQTTPMNLIKPNVYYPRTHEGALAKVACESSYDRCIGHVEACTPTSGATCSRVEDELNHCTRVFNFCVKSCFEEDERELVDSTSEPSAQEQTDSKDSYHDRERCERVRELGGSLTPECKKILLR